MFSICIRIVIQLFISMRFQIRIQGAKPMRIRVWILVRFISHKKFNFYMKNLFKWLKKHTYEGTKALSKDRKQGLFVNFCQFSMLLGPDPHFNTDPDQNSAPVSLIPVVHLDLRLFLRIF
jgi:hypothetical protein